ncbi:DUF1330 domain-containing protein [Gammaproteobacteria bacterium]|nr:DUF1330 domain-containing protein [Gammaproteobacteria bacterium]
MIVLNKLHHSDEQWDALAEMGDIGRVYMINMFKFKERAVYPDGRESDLSGVEAYGLYGAETAKLLAEMGATIAHSSEMLGMIVGEVENLWDSMAIVDYPSLPQFMEMVDSDAWQAHAIHREAGLAGQLNILARNPAG